MFALHFNLDCIQANVCSVQGCDLFYRRNQLIEEQWLYLAVKSTFIAIISDFQRPKPHAENFEHHLRLLGMCLWEGGKNPKPLSKKHEQLFYAGFSSSIAKPYESSNDFTKKSFLAESCFSLPNKAIFTRVVWKIRKSKNVSNLRCKPTY